MEEDLHADPCVGVHCLIIYDHNRPIKVYGYAYKAISNHASIVDAAFADDELKTNQVLILLLIQTIEIKSLNYHLFAQCNVA